MIETENTPHTFTNNTNQLSSNIYSLYKLNIDTKEEEELLQFDETSASVSAYYRFQDIIQTQINKKDEIIVEVLDSKDPKGLNPLYYVLGTKDNKTSLEKLEF